MGALAAFGRQIDAAVRAQPPHTAVDSVHILKPVWSYLRDRARTRAPRLLRAVEAFTGLIVTFTGLVVRRRRGPCWVAMPVIQVVHFFGYVGAVLFIVTLLLAGWEIRRRATR